MPATGLLSVNKYQRQRAHKEKPIYQ